MAAEHRDNIYLQIEAERLKQERNGYTAPDFFTELRAITKIIVAMLWQAGAK